MLGQEWGGEIESVQGLSLKGTDHPGQQIYFSNRGHDGLPFQRAQLLHQVQKSLKGPERAQ